MNEEKIYREMKSARPRANNNRKSLEGDEILPSGRKRDRPVAARKAFSYAAQCVECHKWRKIADQEKFEEIRERAEQRGELFVCDMAWPVASCEDEEEISPDNAKINNKWVVDKPGLPKTPPGWQRIIHPRNPPSTRFADIYYTSPCGVKFRSSVEVEKFLSENTHYVQQGISLQDFSFLPPKLLTEAYDKKPLPALQQ